MKRLMLSAMQSGAGKTVMTCALLAAFRNRGIDVRAFKCGPDYIDPMFHSRVLGIPSRNLDLFLQGRTGVNRTLAEAGGELSVLEGAMGYYDGAAGTAEASAWEVAKETGTPAVLVVRPQGAGLSLAAQIRGMTSFRPETGIRGILLAACRPSLAEYLKPVLERETSLPLFGFLPPMEEAGFPSRHLGLMTAAEISDLAGRIRALAGQAEKTIDIGGLLELAAGAEETFRSQVLSKRTAEPAAGAEEPFRSQALSKRTAEPADEAEETDHGCLKAAAVKAGESIPYPERPVCRIAAARDEAFCFYYEDSFDALRRAGAEVVFFSPLRDTEIPEGTDGLYLGGGYPELYAEELSRNRSMTESIRAGIADGLPVLAECGGFLYLQQTLEDENGKEWPVCRVLPGKGFRTDRLQFFGYQHLQAGTDSMLFRAGEKIPAHEFHYWDCTENGNELLSVKPDGRSRACGYAGETMYAAFPHLHLGGDIPLAERFVRTCSERKATDFF